MRGIGRGVLVAALAVAGAALAAPAGVPVAVYWVSAQTSTGAIAAMMGADGRPSRQAIIAMAMGGGVGPDAVQHSLHLQLGSQRQPGAAPFAEHDPPRGLGVGPSLPLVTSEAPPGGAAQDETPRPPPQFQRPNGRLLIYWGCAEHAGPGQPAVLDLAKLAADPQSLAAMMRGLAPTPMQALSPRRFSTYGEWPNAQSGAPVPATGSLVGDHTVKSDYAPDIRFSLSPDQDFMGPLRLTGNTRLPSGAVRLAWTTVPTALGYFAAVIGAGSGQGGDTLVVWTSANTQTLVFALADYLSPDETRRLVAEGRMIGPQTSDCAVPAEVAQQTHGLVSLAAYGDEANFASSPRSPRPAWTVKVRYRSTTSALLGQPDPMSGRGGQGQPPQDRGAGGLLHGLGGFPP